MKDTMWEWKTNNVANKSVLCTYILLRLRTDTGLVAGSDDDSFNAAVSSFAACSAVDEDDDVGDDVEAEEGDGEAAAAAAAAAVSVGAWKNVLEFDWFFRQLRRLRLARCYIFVLFFRRSDKVNIFV